MKFCPICKRGYDDSMNFCLNDSATLILDTSSQATTQILQPTKKRNYLKYLLVLLALSAGPIAGTIYLLFWADKDGVAKGNSRPTVTTSKPTPAMVRPSATAPPPASAETEPPMETLPAEEPVPQKSVEKDSFRFEVKQCKISSSTLNCELLITNLREDGRFSMYGNNIVVFDNEGNEHRAQQQGSIKVANNENSYQINPAFINNVSTPATFTFEQVSPRAKSISRLNIRFEGDNNRKVEVQIPNIAIIR